jgi:hypothetical protein
VPPPPPTLAQAIAAILESRDEQTELLCQLVVAMGRETPMDPLPPPTWTFWQPVRQPSLKQENRLRLITGCTPLSQYLGSCTAPSTKRHSLQPSNSWTMLGHGGPTSPLHCQPTTKCSGWSSVMLLGPSIFPRALCWPNTRSSWT